MGNGEWGMGNGEWGMGNGEWRMRNKEWRMGERNVYHEKELVLQFIFNKCSPF
jgi:hypothetical protein